MTVSCRIPHDAEGGMRHVLENIRTCLRMYEDLAAAVRQLGNMYADSGYVEGVFSEEPASDERFRAIQFVGTIFGAHHIITCSE